MALLLVVVLFETRRALYLDLHFFHLAAWMLNGFSGCNKFGKGDR